MSEFKGTPGPWNLSRTKRFVKNGYGAPFVCEIDATNGQWEANAHLISAAPELLEALRELEIQALQSLDLLRTEWGQEALAKARAARAKALGEGQ